MKVSSPSSRKKMTLKEFAKLCGVPYKTFHYRLTKGYSVREAATLSHQEMRRLSNTTHGMHGTPEYQAWESMHSRCRRHPHYLKRGIRVCAEWSCFENFYADMGRRPEGGTLDRVENDKDYSPGNCRWASRTEQARNTSRNVFVLGAGRNATVAEVAANFGVRYELALYRAKQGQILNDVVRPSKWGAQKFKRKTKCE